MVRGAQKAAQGKDPIDDPAFPVIAHLSHGQFLALLAGEIPCLGKRKDIIKIALAAGDTR